MLYVLRDRDASPKELSEEFGIPLANAAYHVQVLRKLKLIKLVKKTPRRGAVEHHYRADEDAFAEDSTWGQTAGLVKDAVTGSLLDDVGDQATKAAAAGAFEAEGAHLSRTRLALDDAGWAELSKMVSDIEKRARELDKETKKRTRGSKAAGRRDAALALMLFQPPK